VGGHCVEQRLGYTVKILKFEKGGWVMTSPPPMVAPPLAAAPCLH